MTVDDKMRNSISMDRLRTVMPTALLPIETKILASLRDQPLTAFVLTAKTGGDEGATKTALMALERLGYIAKQDTKIGGRPSQAWTITDDGDTVFLSMPRPPRKVIALKAQKPDAANGARYALSTREEFTAELLRIKANIETGYTEFGRRLIEAKARLPHGEFVRMVEGDLDLSRQSAHRLMCVAAAHDSGAIPQELADAPYMTVYEFLTLPDEARPAALEVVRAQPEAPRKALVAFKRARKAPRATPERDALLAELDQLAVRTAEIERRLAEIDGRGLVAVGLGIRR